MQNTPRMNEQKINWDDSTCTFIIRSVIRKLLQWHKIPYIIPTTIFAKWWTFCNIYDICVGKSPKAKPAILVDPNMV